MKWNGDIEKINPQPGEVIIINGANKLVFDQAVAIRAMFPNNLVLIFTPDQDIKTADERMMNRLGWFRNSKNKGKPDKTIPCDDQSCKEMFMTERSKNAHYRAAHTKAGRERVQKMLAARSKS